MPRRSASLLGIKGLAWRSVQIPMVMPKPDLTALTGGYRKTPVLQIGADIYCDSSLIAQELERRYPTPTLFPDGGPVSRLRWPPGRHRFFDPGSGLAMGLNDELPADLLKDRREFFTHMDFASFRERAALVRPGGGARGIWSSSSWPTGGLSFSAHAPGSRMPRPSTSFWMARGFVAAMDGILSRLFVSRSGRSACARWATANAANSTRTLRSPLRVPRTPLTPRGVDESIPVDCAPGSRCR